MALGTGGYNLVGRIIVCLFAAVPDTPEDMVVFTIYHAIHKPNVSLLTITAMGFRILWVPVSSSMFGWLLDEVKDTTKRLKL